jgi:hypothetical protein
MRTFRYFLFTVVLLFGMLTSCRKDQGKPDEKTVMEGLKVPDGFDWSTTISGRFSVTALDNIDQPIKGAKFSIF